MSTPAQRIEFGVFFQGVNFHTIWTAAESGSQTEFESFRRVAQTAERGGFAVFFLGEGLRMREHLGRIHDTDIAGRPDALTQLSALAAVTTRIGLVATQNATYNSAVDLARRLHTLDALSGGRAGWNVVTTDNAWTGENFRRGGYLDHADRYTNAERVVDDVRQAWRELRLGTDRPDPVLFQAGDSPTGRDFAVRNVDVVYSRHAAIDDAERFAEDLRARCRAAGRDPSSLKIFAGQTIVLGDTDADAQEAARWMRENQISGTTALRYLEQLWGCDLSDYDPDGPLPDIDPVSAVAGATRGALFGGLDAVRTARSWRERAAASGASIRRFVIETTTPRTLVGTPSAVADTIGEYVWRRAVDGFNLTPYLVPGGLDAIVERLVPELRERGIYRTDEQPVPLHSALGLPSAPAHALIQGEA